MGQFDQMRGKTFTRGGRLSIGCLGILLTTCYHPPHERTEEWDLEPGQQRPDRATAQQIDAEEVPQSPGSFSPDTGMPPASAPAPRSSIVDIKRETIITEDPPLPPSQFNPDPGQGWNTGPEEVEEAEGQVEAPADESGEAELLAGGETEPSNKGLFFGKDAGLGDNRFFPQDSPYLSENGSFFKRDAGVPKKQGPRFEPAIPGEMLLPRPGVIQNRIDAEIVEAPLRERYHPDISQAYQLPRDDVRYERRIYEHWHAGHHEHLETPTGFTAVEDRWRIATGVWERYLEDGIAETPYERKTPYLWHPYYQSTLKGDIPVIGQDIFASLTLQNITDIEHRNIPTPAGISTARPGSAEFYGDGDGVALVSNTSLTFDLFRGETSFKPVEWLFRIQPVFNTNYISVEETTLVSPDPRGLDQFTRTSPGDIFSTNPSTVNPGDVDIFLDPLLNPASSDFRHTRATERLEDHLALQQFFFEIHLADLSDNYDFAALRMGTQTFNADFRGHVFFDSNWGYRLSGNLAKNRFQYNIAFFDLFEKESFSELNTWHNRNQNVFIANLYWQDLFFKGYTAQVNFLANWDRGSQSGLVYDSAGNIARPTPIGTVAPHDLEAYYLGLNGEGHIGRMNISHSLYHVFGKDELNGIAGREVDISAWMAALELSVDTDWMRHKLTFFYASGDDDATDGKAKGWDSIVDNPNFIGGPFSYWQRQGPNLGGTAVALKQRLSLIPNLRSNKFLGQSSFVNPGIFIAGIGEEWELTPKTRVFANLNYLMFVETDAIGTALVTNEIDREIGWDLSFGVQHRPFLTENLKLAAGLGFLFPGAGLKDIYRLSSPGVTGFTSQPSEEIDDVLLSGFLSATMTF